ncbi:MAG: BamA/TamA family outer membrane protein [Gemmatimonadota bacterium]
MVRRRLILGALLSLGALLGPAVQLVEAQAGRYFGRNKVVYRSFDFKVLKTEHFDIYYYDDEAEAAQMAARMAERWYARLSRVLNHEFRRAQPIILYADHTDFEQTNATPQQIDESTGGFTEILKRRVVLPLAGTIAESDQVLGHELVHAFQFDMTGQGPSATGVDIPGAIRLPLWFIEGMAEYLSIGPIHPFTTMWMRDALDLEEGFPTIPDLRNPKYFPYRYGHAMWSYIAGNFGDDKIGRILILAGQTGSALGAMEAVLEVPIMDLSERWANDLEAYFAGARTETESPDAFGRRVIYEREEGDGSLNLGPSISPDGSKLMYTSERDLFAVEMFLADARTGEVIRRMTRTSVDPHFESLQWINSSGEWHPDGRHFVVAGVNKGSSIISVIDTENGNIVREVKLRGVGDAFTPTWSPDGEQVAFSAMSGGFLDLYIVDLESETLVRLTADPYADLQPMWSPDGRYLAFSTDRFTTNLQQLVGGGYELALYDIETGEIESLPSFTDQKHNLNPQWSPDGRNLYFVSDHDGIANVYRLDMETREQYLVTNVWTGISGLTSTSPAISVARASGDVAFAVNKGGPFNFEIYVMDDPEVLAGVPAPDRLVEVDASIIPPRERVSTDHLALLQNPRLGLADPITFDKQPYRSKLQLDYVSQPTLAFGASSFGVFFAGGASLFFSDLLGDKTLQAVLSVNTAYGDFVRSTAMLVGYEDRSARWNLAAVAGQVPFVTRQFQFFSGDIDGRRVDIFRELRYFQINRQVTGIVSYPLNRTSRFDFLLGASQLDFAATTKDFGFDSTTGELLIDQSTDLPRCTEEQVLFVNCAPSPIYLASGGAAFIYDSSIFGGTSPILGQRIRLSADPAFGSINFVSVTGDVRKYLRFAPFTLAGRGLHVGRYGSGGQDPRLGRLYLGVPSLVRGYASGSLRISECTSPGGATGFFTCPEFDELLGSRLAVANVELRLPLIGGIGVIHAPGVPPIEVGAFYDMGKAWTTDADLSCFISETCTFGDRPWKRSAGMFSRLNLFGFMIVELDFVRPFDRPDRGWMWQFSLTPGF